MAQRRMIGTQDRQSLRAGLRLRWNARELFKRAPVLTLPKEQDGALVMCLSVRWVVGKHSLVNMQGFVARLGIGSRVFLIQAPEVQVGGSESWRALYGIGEVFFGGREVTLLSRNHAVQVLESGIGGKARRRFGEKAVGLGPIAAFELTLDLQNLALFVGRSVLAGLSLKCAHNTKRAHQQRYSKYWRPMAHLGRIHGEIIRRGRTICYEAASRCSILFCTNLNEL